MARGQITPEAACQAQAHTLAGGKGSGLSVLGWSDARLGPGCGCQAQPSVSASCLLDLLRDQPHQAEGLPRQAPLPAGHRQRWTPECWGPPTSGPDVVVWAASRIAASDGRYPSLSITRVSSRSAAKTAMLSGFAILASRSAAERFRWPAFWTLRTMTVRS